MTERYLNAQIAVLGSVLIDDRVAGRVIHRTREEDFTGEYRTIYRAIKMLFVQNRPVDPVTVIGEVGEGYVSLLKQMMDLTPTAANVDTYIDLTLEASQLARLRTFGADLAECQHLKDARGMLDQMNRSLGERPSVKVITMAEGIKSFQARQKTTPKFLPWGLGKLDGVVMAELAGDFIVIGGYPSAGKTALSVQVAWAQAESLRVGYFSLETKQEKLVDRAVAMVTGVDFGRIKRHQLGSEDWRAISGHAVSMMERNLSIIQAGGLTVADIQALSLASHYDVIFIDYLQLIQGENSRVSDFERVTQISMALHTMAQTTGITVVALSQLTRPEKGKDAAKAPTLHSLRQSGQIEQDADAVLLLYKENSKDPRSRRHLSIAKNKEGESGGILLLDFDGATQRFTPASDTKAVAGSLARQGRAAKNANRATQLSFPLSESDSDSPW